MAVQAQHPYHLAFVPDFRNNPITTSRPLVNVVDDFPLGGAAGNSDPQSELTCNVTGSRKRSRGETNRQESPAMADLPIQFAYPNRFCYDQQQLQPNRLSESAGDSTSGRPSDLISDLYSHLFRQNLEIDAIIRLQNERLRSELEESRKRQCRALMSSVECHVARKLREKDTELEMASRRNAELEEKIRQMSAESQIWFNVAKNNEAIVTSLKSTLEQVLLQNSTIINNNNNNSKAVVVLTEGYGDSDGTPFPAGDVQSYCFEGNDVDADGAVREIAGTATVMPNNSACKVCGEKDVCVLLLPCRHLCLCKDCESTVDTCPICNGNKNACLQVFVS